MSSIYQSRISIKDVPRSSVFNSNMHSYAPFSRISRINRNERDISIDFGNLRTASLANLINPKQEGLESPQMKKLATTYNNKLIINEKVIKQIESAYPNNLLAFYAVYGRKNAGKSFWCDKTYDLSDVGGGKGHYYTQAQRQQGVYFLNVPFTKGDIKIFLLDCTGFQDDRLSRNEEMRLDFIMTLSSAVLLLPEPEDKECKVMNTAYHQFVESQKRLRMFDEPANKRSGYWPHSCYCLYRTTEPVSKNLEDLGQLFDDYNFSIIQDAKNPKYQGENKDFVKSSFLDIDNSMNQQYLNHVAYVTRDVYDKIWGKKYGNLKSNGRVISKLIPFLSLQMNAREKVPMEKVFDDTTKALYDDAVKNSSMYYGEAVKSSFSNVDKNKPVDTNTLVGNLNLAKSKVLTYFDNESKYIDPTSKYAEEAELKVDDMMNNQQISLMNVKEKLSIDHLEKTLPRVKDQEIETYQDFRAYLMKLKNAETEVDQSRSVPVSKRLKQACDQSRNKIFVVNEDTEKLYALQQSNDKKRSEILSLEKKIREKQSKQTNIMESVLILRSKGSNLDSQIERLKRRNETELQLLNNPNQEEADRLRIQQMNKNKKDAEERLLEIQRQRDQYNKWHSNKDSINREVMISTLLTKLEDKKKEKEKNQSVFLTSQLTSKIVSGIRGAEVRPVGKDSINRSRFIA